MLKKRVLVTGVAGFIGYHLVNRLHRDGYQIVGIDNVNDYYDVSLKEARLANLAKLEQFSFQRLDLEDKSAIMGLFAEHGFSYAVNLAAQAGVRHSLSHPYTYINSNVTGFLNILEACRHYPVEHLVYASSSSVYGANTSTPFSVHDGVDHPLSLYAVTKKANELMAHSYSNLYNIPTTGLRFFSAYGPYGRPDMALFIFVKSILEDKPIDVFNFGKMKRDFTYIDDLTESIARLLPLIPQPNPQWSGAYPDPASSFAPFKIYNIGNNNPVDLLTYIEYIEEILGKKAEKNFLPMQVGDVPANIADVDDLMRDIDFRPNTPVRVGIERFIAWYREYYRC
jgi:UDP-glucuronate 4-epimerase